METILLSSCEAASVKVGLQHITISQLEHIDCDCSMSDGGFAEVN
jgi:hypothetical protein